MLVSFQETLDGFQSSIQEQAGVHFVIAVLLRCAAHGLGSVQVLPNSHLSTAVTPRMFCILPLLSLFVACTGPQVAWFALKASKRGDVGLVSGD